jgi:hypothetical protein
VIDDVFVRKDLYEGKYKPDEKASKRYMKVNFKKDRLPRLARSEISTKCKKIEFFS